MAIGLKRGTVKLLPHNKNWKSLFEKEKAKIKKALGDLAIDIQHIGSTSIPNIVAKPIIDISVGVNTLRKVPELINKFKSIGYEFRDIPHEDKQILFVKGPESKRTHYVHVMKFNGKTWNNDLLFRDYLRKNRRRAKQYENLKKELANQHANDRAIYTANKASFILETLTLAKKKS